MQTVSGRWLLLLVLAAGLVGMHHLAAGSPSGPAMTAASMASTVAADLPVGTAAGPVLVAAGSGPSMDMAMHLCLAVLAAIAAMALLGLLGLAVGELTRRPPTASPCAAVRTPARPPPRSAVRLALLCVLRN